MNYTFNEGIIHDDKVMWSLAVAFICRYEFLRGQIQKSKIEGTIILRGKIIMEHDKNYRSILINYKKELRFMNDLIESELEFGSVEIQRNIHGDNSR